VHFSLFPPNADLAPVAKWSRQRPDIVAVGGHDVLLVDFVKAMAATGNTPKAIIELRDHRCLLRAGARPPSRRLMGISVWFRVFQGRPVRLGR
jgi:branched-chain amino acid transport system substrate-binding protein